MYAASISSTTAFGEARPFTMVVLGRRYFCWPHGRLERSGRNIYCPDPL